MKTFAAAVILHSLVINSIVAQTFLDNYEKRWWYYVDFDAIDRDLPLNEYYLKGKYGKRFVMPKGSTEFDDYAYMYLEVGG